MDGTLPRTRPLVFQKRVKNCLTIELLTLAEPAKKAHNHMGAAEGLESSQAREKETQHRACLPFDFLSFKLCVFVFVKIQCKLEAWWVG